MGSSWKTKTVPASKKYRKGNPWGRAGRPTFMSTVIKGMKNALSSPFKKSLI